MNATIVPDAPAYPDLGAVPLDTGWLQIVDPVNLPPDLVAALLTRRHNCLAPAVMVNTACGDSTYDVHDKAGRLSISDPWFERFESDQEMGPSRWGTDILGRDISEHGSWTSAASTEDGAA